LSYMPKSKSDVYETPDVVYDVITSNWGYLKEEMFDPCPINPDFDGLSIDWHKVNFVNPPYSLLSEFIMAALEEKDKGNVTIMLLPSKTDQQWFHDLISKGYEIQWIRGRLKFKGEKWGAPQPHFLVMIK